MTRFELLDQVSFEAEIISEQLRFLANTFLFALASLTGA